MTVHNPGATPLYAAACAARCAARACSAEAGAKVDARTSNDASPMLVCCQDGHLEVAQLLSSYGASRDPIFAFCVPCGSEVRADGPILRAIMGLNHPAAIPTSYSPSSQAEKLAEKNGHTELLKWLRQSVEYPPLLHIEALTPQRTTALLRGGASPVERHGGVTAAELAAKLPPSEAGRLILRAAAPWSPADHELWGAKARARFRAAQAGVPDRRRSRARPRLRRRVDRGRAAARGDARPRPAARAGRARRRAQARRLERLRARAGGDARRSSS